MHAASPPWNFPRHEPKCLLAFVYAIFIPTQSKYLYLLGANHQHSIKESIKESVKD